MAEHWTLVNRLVMTNSFIPANQNLNDRSSSCRLFRIRQRHYWKIGNHSILRYLSFQIELNLYNIIHGLQGIFPKTHIIININFTNFVLFCIWGSSRITWNPKISMLQECYVTSTLVRHPQRDKLTQRNHYYRLKL